MHSAHRDLETKYKRTRQDLVQALGEKEQLQESLNNKTEEVTELKTRCTELENKYTTASERIESQIRELKIKTE